MKDMIESVLDLLNDDPSVLSYERAKSVIKERWGENFSKITPSHILKIGEKLKIYKHIKRELVHSQEFVDHNYENGRHLIGAYGLIILQHYDVVCKILEPGSFVLGIDSKKFLPKGVFFDPVVPVLEKIRDGEYKYFELPYGMHLETDEYFLVSED